MGFVKMEDNEYNEDYFEHGEEKGISGYTNYSYMPTRSYEEASMLKERWKEGRILDYGCAKGYLVHALNQLGFEAYGYDLSTYAIDNCHPQVKELIYNVLDDSKYEYVICKDVMEHIPEDKIVNTLKEIKHVMGEEALFVIPLGDDNKFRIREYEYDITHVTKKDEDWWVDKFKEAGFIINNFKYVYGDIKKKWTGKYDYGNGFFFVR